MTITEATPPDAVKARVRALLLVDRPLTDEERAEWVALTGAYRALRRTEKRATRAGYRGVDPYRHVPFACSGCGAELRPRQPHGILDGGRILCDGCLAGEDAPLVWASDRAAAVAWLDSHGLINHDTKE